jgi:hypothetical protein
VICYQISLYIHPKLVLTNCDARCSSPLLTNVIEISISLEQIEIPSHDLSLAFCLCNYSLIVEKPKLFNAIENPHFSSMTGSKTIRLQFECKAKCRYSTPRESSLHQPTLLCRTLSYTVRRSRLLQTTWSLDLSPLVSRCKGGILYV